jgi:RNA polymerase sigma factor (sigma-70 family)
MKAVPEPADNDRFLELFDHDRLEAERKYRLLRAKLVFYFQHNACLDPENLADEVFARVLRRNAEGVDFYSGLSAYCYGIAEHIAREDSRQPKSGELPEEIPQQVPASPSRMNRAEQHLLVQQCLQCLSEADRDLFLRYHLGDRTELASQLQVTGNTLRIRICRIKRKLEENMAKETLASGAGKLK